MKYRSVLAFLVLCTAAQAAEVEETESLQITKKRAQECAAGGGCALVTADEVKEMLERVYAAGKSYSDATCASKIEFRER